MLLAEELSDLPDLRKTEDLLEGNQRLAVSSLGQVFPSLLFFSSRARQSTCPLLHSPHSGHFNRSYMNMREPP